MNNELPENIGLGWLLLVLAMPFITGFHVAMGAPWMLTAVLVEVVCLGSLVVSAAYRATDELEPEESSGLVETEPDKVKS